MADPYDSDSAVEQILSEARDLHVLEQISSINLSGVSSDSLLPTDLETRFRKLKSFPAANPKRHTLPSSLNSQTGEIPTTPIPLQSTPIPISASPDYQELDFKPKSRKGYVSSSSSDEEDSPPTALCFLCSPKSKKTSKKKQQHRKNKSRGRVNDDDGDDNDDVFALDSILSEMNTRSLKDQRRSLRKALKEQEKISREAEKVVDLAKQLSSRIVDFDIHDHDHDKSE